MPAGVRLHATKNKFARSVDYIKMSEAPRVAPIYERTIVNIESTPASQIGPLIEIEEI